VFGGRGWGADSEVLKYAFCFCTSGFRIHFFQPMVNKGNF